MPWYIASSISLTWPPSYLSSYVIYGFFLGSRLCYGECRVLEPKRHMFFLSSHAWHLLAVWVHLVDTFPLFLVQVDCIFTMYLCHDNITRQGQCGSRQSYNTVNPFTYHLKLDFWGWVSLHIPPLKEKKPHVAQCNQEVFKGSNPTSQSGLSKCCMLYVCVWDVG